MIGLHLSCSAGRVQWSGEQCLLTLHTLCKKQSCGALLLAFLPFISQLDLVLTGKVGYLDSLKRLHFLCSHFSFFHHLHSEENCMKGKDLNALSSRKGQRSSELGICPKNFKQDICSVTGRNKTEGGLWVPQTAEDHLLFFITSLFKR